MKLLIVLLIAGLFVPAQTFEVASIRPSPHCDDSGLSRGASSPGQLAMECADLRDLILTAYGIYASASLSDPGGVRMQVTGGPRWIDSERFDIQAIAPGNPSRAEMLGPMLRSLLEERFHLKVHRETKDGPIFKLTVARNGAKLQPSAACVAPCGSTSIRPKGVVVFSGVTMKDLSARLSIALDREVLDSTGLTGRYDFQLQVDPSDLNPRLVAGRDRSATAGPEASSIFTALQEQLGLRLEPARGLVSTIMVDAIEHPTEN